MRACHLLDSLLLPIMCLALMTTWLDLVAGWLDSDGRWCWAERWEDTPGAFLCGREALPWPSSVYSSKEQSQSERVVFAINDQIDDHCPKCINDTVYVEKLISLPIEQGEFYLCRCGKCGWRFRVNAAEVRRSTNARRRGDRIITL
jgi:hypothetical protein